MKVTDTNLNYKQCMELVCRIDMVRGAAKAKSRCDRVVNSLMGNKVITKKERDQLIKMVEEFRTEIKRYPEIWN